jgi:hypothetical protein
MNITIKARHLSNNGYLKKIMKKYLLECIKVGTREILKRRRVNDIL